MKKLISSLLIVLASPCLAADVPVAARVLERGTVIDAGDMVMAEASATSNRTTVQDMRNIVGKELKRTLNEGDSFRTSDLKSPTLIKRGQLVTLYVRSGGLQIAAAGRALQDGSVGELIKAQNTTSRTIVEGSVSRDGTVTVDMVGAPVMPDAQ
jgi:flagellar basal body P-ring formation protein FlgA